MGFRINLPSQPYSYRSKPCQPCCGISTAKVVHAVKADLIKHGAQEYTNVEPDVIERFKNESFSLAWSVAYSFGGSSMGIGGTFSQTNEYSDKTGAQTVTREGLATQETSDETATVTNTATFNDSTGSWDCDFGEGSGLADGSFGNSFIQPAVAKYLAVNDVIPGYSHSGTSHSFWKVTSVVFEQTSIIISGIVNNPTWSGAWSGSFIATWSLSDLNTTANVKALADALLAGVDLSSFPWPTQPNYGRLVTVAYGGCESGDSFCLDAYAASTEAAEDTRDAAAAILTDKEADETEAVTAMGTAQSEYDSALSAWESAKTAHTTAKAEKEAAERNLATWERRNDAGEIATATTRLETANSDLEDATTELSDADIERENKKNALESAKLAVANAKFYVENATYELAIADLYVSLMEQNETTAAAGPEGIMITGMFANVSESAEHLVSSNEQVVSKRKIRYRLNGFLSWVPKDSDESSFAFNWREGAFGSAVAFTDKEETGITITENEFAHIGSLFARYVWSGSYDIAAPAEGTEVKIIGSIIQPEMFYEMAHKGGIFQKLGILGYTHSSPAKVFRTETIAGNVDPDLNGYQQVSSDGYFFHYNNDFAVSNPYRSLIPIFDGPLGVDWHLEKSPAETTETTKTFSDGTTATLSDEFTTAELEGYVSELIDGDFQFADEYYPFPDTYITSPLLAYKVSTADNTVRGEKRTKFYHGLNIPDTVPLEDLDGLAVNVSFPVYEKSLADGTVTETEQTITFTFEDPAISRLVYIAEEEEFILECSTANTIKWVGPMTCDFVSDYLYTPFVSCSLDVAT